MLVNVYFIFWQKTLRDERECERPYSIPAATAFSKQQQPDSKSLKNEMFLGDCVVNFVDWK